MRPFKYLACAFLVNRPCLRAHSLGPVTLEFHNVIGKGVPDGGVPQQKRRGLCVGCTSPTMCQTRRPSHSQTRRCFNYDEEHKVWMDDRVVGSRGTETRRREQI